MEDNELAATTRTMIQEYKKRERSNLLRAIEKSGGQGVWKAYKMMRK